MFIGCEVNFTFTNKLNQATVLLAALSTAISQNFMRNVDSNLT